jgi:hypothetical protein
MYQLILFIKQKERFTMKDISKSTSENGISSSSDSKNTPNT